MEMQNLILYMGGAAYAASGNFLWASRNYPDRGHNLMKYGSQTCVIIALYIF